MVGDFEGVAVRRRVAQVIGSRVRASVVLLVAIVVTLGAAQQARASSLTPGDVVVYRVGPGGEAALSGNATSAFLNEFTPSGTLKSTFAFPTTPSTSGNRALVASGSASSEGLLTLSADGQYLLATGYNASPGAESISGTKAKTINRTVGRVSGAGVINTETALEDFADKNNPRSATSSNGTKIWVSGAEAGVRYTELAKKTSTSLQSLVTNARQVSIFNNQLYASADPGKNGASGFSIATVGTGLPQTGSQLITSLPFETAPEQPFAYSFVRLGLEPGSEPNTVYVADNKLGGVSKYGLEGGKWIRKGTVEIPFVTGVAARDVEGVVTVYATSSGKNGTSGTLYKFQDLSNVNGILTGAPVEIATAPANEAYRGVAFAPGTTFESGGTPPAAPTITTPEPTLAAAFGDPTNQSMPVTVGDSEYAASELTVTVRSSNETVAPVGNISVTGGGASRTLSVTPAAVGTSKITLTVEAPNKYFTSTVVNYGASANQEDASDRYYAGAGNASTAIDVGNGYVILGDDETNVLHLYHERTSSEPVKSFDFTSQLKGTEIDIEASARAGNTLYWLGSMSNKHNGEAQPNRDVLFAATITGSGASTELTYLGKYTELREDLIKWDEANGNPLGLAKSAEPGSPSDLPSGFNAEGLEFAAGSSSEAYVAFRAPLEPPVEERHLALLVPVTNLSSLVGGGIKATFGTALEWNLGGGAIREIRRNADGEFLVITGSAEEIGPSFSLYGWDGEPEDEPVLLDGPFSGVAEGAWEDITATPDPIVNSGQVELIEDNGETEWYKNLQTSKTGLLAGLQKDLGRLFTVQIPPPGTPNPPHQSSGATLNTGQFTLRWKPAPTLRARFTLQHQNAKGGWSTVATGLSSREYTFTSGSREAEGTWNYRVKESNETAPESGYSAESEPIKVDRTPPNTPTATPSRAPDYADGGGWYKDSIAVSFSANGDPTLADTSSPSGVDATTLTGPQTFNTSGSHTASGTVADKVGNVSSAATLAVQVDATPPALSITCPATALVREEGVTATVTASDGESGLASDPSAAVPIDTSQVGPQTTTRTAIDNVGHETTKSCTTQIVYPTPGAPKLTAGVSPNGDGVFTLGWSGDDPLQFSGLSYALQHHNAASATWSTVASNIGALSYAFEGSGEEEGTWVYRVQGSDPGHGQTTEYSPDSSAVVVDESPPFPPSTGVSRPPDYAGNGGWYKKSVTVSFSKFIDATLSDGSPGSGIDPASIPASQTITTSGSDNACATVADNVGNVSAPNCRTVQVEATPPTLAIECPATALKGSNVSAKVTASDPYSGLQTDPSGTVPIDTSQTGKKTTTRTAVSFLGYETTKSCTTTVESSTPGAPALTAGKTPNKNGRFTLGWSGPDPLQYFGLSYTLEHHDAATTTWSTVAKNIGERSYEFAGGGEEEGTWVYRVWGADPSIGLTSEYSPDSNPVVVDRTPPNPPTGNASRSPDYAGNGGWYKDSVAVSFTVAGDPDLNDGSPGSGADPSTLPAPATFTTTGSHTASGTVADKAGNVSVPGTLVVKVDATPPTLEAECPATAVVGQAGVSATLTAADAESGLASDPSGPVPISTERAGPVTVTRTAIDHVGHSTTKSCTTQVLESPPEFGRCVKVPAETVGGKTVYHGWFTTSTCHIKSSTQTSPYEWVSGAVKTGFTIAISPKTKVVFKTSNQGGGRVSCNGETATGVVTSAKAVGSVVIHLTGCYIGFTEGEPCTTAGRATGELETKKLEGVLGIERVVVESGKETRYVGLDLYPVGKSGTFLEYSCPGEPKTTISGSVIGPVTLAMSKVGNLKHVASVAKQQPESFAGGEKDILTNGQLEPVGLTDKATLKFEEKLEINAFF
jgi:hypothetical protein